MHMQQSGGIHGNEGDNGVHQNGIESSISSSGSSKGSNSSLDHSSGQSLARSVQSNSGKTVNKQSNGASSNNSNNGRKGKKVQQPNVLVSAGKGSSQQLPSKQLVKSDSEDEATPISVSIY